MKKIISLILALVLIMSLAVTASAAGISIVPNAPVGSDTNDITYTARKLLDAEVTDTGTVYSVAVTETQIVSNLDGRWQVIVDGTSTSGVLFNKTLSADGTKYYVTLTELGEKVSAGELAHCLNFSWKGTDISIPFDQTSGKYVKEGLDPGYYYVESNLGGMAIIETINGTVEIETKNEYPTVTKKVNGATTATVDEGNTVTFTLEVQLTNGGSREYIVHDRNEGVTINKDTVKIVDQNGNTITPTFLTNPSPYTWRANACSTCEMDLAFSYTDAGKTLTITYEGTVNALQSDAENTAWVTINTYDSPNVPIYKSAESTVTISNAQFSIYKHTGSDKSTENPITPLQGAGFVVAKTDDAGSTVYYKMESGVVSWVSDIDDATEVISDAQGAVIFQGLAAGTYTAIEKTVPAGYNKAEDTEFEITTDADGIAEDYHVLIENKVGSLLPSTGGMGTTLFYLFGALMFIGAGVLLVTNKRMKESI